MGEAGGTHNWLLLSLQRFLSMDFIYSVKQSDMLDFSYNIFVLLHSVISARIPLNDSDSALPKSGEKLRLILLIVST